MSDWQHCVDWLWAKYCRCRLRLDWCWCRWRTSVKGRFQWGLQVRRRQVDLVRGTQWPAGSSAGRMVARTSRRSRGLFLGWASKPRSSQSFVGAESWVVIGGGYTELVGFPVVHQKTTRFLSWSTKPRPKTGEQQHQVGLTSGFDRSDRCATTRSGCFEVENTRRDRKACVKAKQVCGRRASVRWCYDEDSQSALRGRVCWFNVIGVVLSFGCLHITQVVRGWQPSLETLAHFPFLFSLPIFFRIF
jgi:hypothetical protein